MRPASPPGHSGNPGGRAKGFGHLIRRETREGAELVQAVLGILRSARKPELKLQAANWLADRGWGKPVPTVQPGEGPAFPRLLVLEWGSDSGELPG